MWVVKSSLHPEDADGNLAGYTDGTTSATYTYDDAGRKLTETVNYGSFSKEYSYTYYGNGLKHTFTAPDEQSTRISTASITNCGTSRFRVWAQFPFPTIPGIVRPR